MAWNEQVRRGEKHSSRSLAYAIHLHSARVMFSGGEVVAKPIFLESSVLGWVGVANSQPKGRTSFPLSKKIFVKTDF